MPHFIQGLERSQVLLLFLLGEMLETWSQPMVTKGPVGLNRGPSRHCKKCSQNSCPDVVPLGKEHEPHVCGACNVEKVAL